MQDSLVDVILDPTFLGTDAELKQALSEGSLEKYFVIENGLLYERIRKPLEVEESFLEEYWIYIGIASILVAIIFYKLSRNKNDTDVEVDKESQNIE